MVITGVDYGRRFDVFLYKGIGSNVLSDMSIIDSRSPEFEVECVGEIKPCEPWILIRSFKLVVRGSSVVHLYCTEDQVTVVTSRVVQMAKWFGQLLNFSEVMFCCNLIKCKRTFVR